MTYTPKPIDLAAEKPTTSTGEVVHDADTIGGKRAAAYDAPEVTKVGSGSDVPKFAEPAGYVVRDQVADVLNNEGYLHLDSNEKDVYGRPLTHRRQKESGKYLDEELVARGIVQPGEHSSALSNERIDGAWSSFAWEQARNGVENVSEYERAEGLAQALISRGNYFDRYVDFDMSPELARQRNKITSNAYTNGLHKKAESIDALLEQGNLPPAEQANLEAERKAIDQDLIAAAIMIDDAPDTGLYQGASYNNSGAGVAGQLWESLELAGYNLVNRFYGFNAFAASGLDNKEYYDWATKGIEKTDEDIAREIDTPLLDLRDIKDVGDAAQWAGNNLTLFGPDYAMMAGLPIAGAKLGAALGPGGALVGGAIGTALSLGYTALISYGDAASAQYEHDKKVDFGKVLPIGTGVLLMERIGLGKAPLKPGQIFTKDGADKAIDILVDQNPTWTRKVASEYFDKNLKKVVKDITDDGALDAAHFLSRTKRAGHAATRIAKRSGREAVTEAAQEALQELGIKGIPESGEDREKFLWLLANSAAVGGLIGGTLNTPGAIGESAYIRQLEKSTQELTRDDLTKKQKIEDDIRKEYGEEAILEDQLAKLQTDQDLSKLGTRHAEGNYLLQGITGVAEGRVIPGASAAANAVRNIRFGADGKANPEVAVYENITGSLQTMGGSTHANAKQNRLGRVSTYIDIANFNDQLGTVDDKQTQELFDAIAAQNSPTVDLDVLPKHLQQPAENLLVMMSHIAENNSNYWRQSDSEQVFNAKQERQNDVRSLFQPDLPDLNELKDRPQEAAAALAEAVPTLSVRGAPKGKKIGETKAREIIDDLIENNNTQDHIGFLKGLENNQAFNEFYSTNSVKNLLDNHIQNIQQSTFNQYYGKEGSKIMDLIQKSLDAGRITQAQAEVWAGEAIRQVQKEKGSFKRIKNPTAKSIQDFALAINTMITLDLTAFAQVGEAVFAFNAVSSNEPITKSVSTISSIYAAEVKDFLRAWGLGPKYKPKFKNGRDFSKDIEDTSLTSDDVDWNTRTREFGYTPVQVLLRENPHLDSKLWSAVTSKFFQLNGNQAITLATKASLLSQSWPTITKLLEREARYAKSGKMTKVRRANTERLNYYGVDTKFMLDLQREFPSLDPADPDFNEHLRKHPDVEAKFVEGQMNAMTKMVNEMTAQVIPGSRPTAIEDPRLAMFTQFTSFISHWHARVVPRLWTQYVAQGSPVMALHTFKVAATAMMLAGVAQWMKDLLKYGDIHDEENEFYKAGRSRLISSPYNDSELDVLQRALDYTGILGHGSSLGLDRLNKVYDFGQDSNPITNPEEFQKQHDGSAFKWLLSELTDLPPISNTIQSTTRALASDKEGLDYAEGVLKKVPFGDVKAIRGGGLTLLEQLGVE